MGVGVHAGIVNGRALCCMFNHAIRGHATPKRLSSDNDPLYRFHQWQANLRVLGVHEVKSVPYVPQSHPFVERLIGTIRRECLDRMLFWSAVDLEQKLSGFTDFYNENRTHASLGRTNADPEAAECRNARLLSMGRALSRTLSESCCSLKTEQGRFRPGVSMPVRVQWVFASCNGRIGRPPTRVNGRGIGVMSWLTPSERRENRANS